MPWAEMELWRQIVIVGLCVIAGGIGFGLVVCLFTAGSKW